MIGKPKFGTLSQYLATHPMLMYEKWEWEGNPPLPQTTISNRGVKFAVQIVAIRPLQYESRIYRNSF